MNTSSTRIDAAVATIRDACPEATVTAEVIEGRVVDGLSLEIRGHYGVDKIEVKAKTAKDAVDLMMRELERARSERQSYVWPPPLND